MFGMEKIENVVGVLDMETKEMLVRYSFLEGVILKSLKFILKRRFTPEGLQIKVQKLDDSALRFGTGSSLVGFSDTHNFDYVDQWVVFGNGKFDRLVGEGNVAQRLIGYMGNLNPACEKEALVPKMVINLVYQDNDTRGDNECVLFVTLYKCDLEQIKKAFEQYITEAFQVEQ